MHVVEHLADLGLHPDDIDLLICTHFDIDHVGYHDTFGTRSSLFSANTTSERATVMRGMPSHAPTGIIRRYATG